MDAGLSIIVPNRIALLGSWNVSNRVATTTLALFPLTMNNFLFEGAALYDMAAHVESKDHEYKRVGEGSDGKHPFP